MKRHESRHAVPTAVLGLFCLFALAATAAADATYFAVQGVGIVKLENKQFTVIPSELKYPRELAVGPDGTVWIAAIDGVFKLSGEQIERVTDRMNRGPDQIAVAPDGTVWGTSYSGIHHFDGTEWTVEEKAALGDGNLLLKDLAVTPDGTVWVLSSNAVHRRDEDGWKSIDTSALIEEGRKLYFNSLAVTPSGRVFAGHSNGIVEMDENSARAVHTGTGPLSELSHLAIGPDGRIHATLAGNELVVIEPDQKQVRTGRIEALAVDRSGRTWLNTDNGIVIAKPDRTTVEWVPGSVQELSGTITDIAVVGSGPALPFETAVEIATGGVTGTIELDGEPLSGAAVEICNNARSYFSEKDSPCSRAAFQKTTQTDENGRFTFEGVPLGRCELGIQIGETWFVTYDNRCEKIRENEVLDSGLLSLKSPAKIKSAP